MIFLRRFFSIFFNGTAGLHRKRYISTDINLYHTWESEIPLYFSDCIIGLFLVGAFGVSITILVFVFTKFLLCIVICLNSLLIVWSIMTILLLIFFCRKRIKISWLCVKQGWMA